MKTNLYTARQIALIFNLTEYTIKRLAREKLIPCYRFGYRILRFDIEEVRAALEKNVRVKAF